MPLKKPTIEPETAGELLAYFLRHPRAADSLEGVVRWRLREETVKRSVDEVDNVLGWLVQEGFLLKESVVGSDAIFSLNPAKAAEARRWIEERARERR